MADIPAIVLPKHGDRTVEQMIQTAPEISGQIFTLVFHGTVDAVLQGDLDGDGKLDNADYQALREMLKKQ